MAEGVKGKASRSPPGESLGDGPPPPVFLFDASSSLYLRGLVEQEHDSAMTALLGMPNPQPPGKQVGGTGRARRRGKRRRQEEGGTDPDGAEGDEATELEPDAGHAGLGAVRQQQAGKGARHGRKRALLNCREGEGAGPEAAVHVGGIYGEVLRRRTPAPVLGTTGAAGGIGGAGGAGAGCYLAELAEAGLLRESEGPRWVGSS